MVELNGKTIPEVFQNQVKKYGNKPCVSYIPNGVTEFHDLSWNEMNKKIKHLAAYLVESGIQKGDRIALFSENRHEWWVGDQAILAIGAVNVPIYATNSAEESLYILDHSGSKVCLCSSKDHAEKIFKNIDKLPDLNKVISFDEFQMNRDDFITLNKIIEDNKYSSFNLEKSAKSINPESMATIIYTSGTTGDPKGVMLSHNNFVSNIRQIFTKYIEYIKPEQKVLSFLPLSHSLERTAGYYLAMSAGAIVAFAREFSKVVEDMQVINPDFIISVPRLFEKIHSTILSRLTDVSIFKRGLFSLATSVARRNLPNECKDKPRKGFFKIIYNLFNKLVYSKMRTSLGMSNLTFAVSGGAPLSVNDAEFFIGMGVKILEGFGLTETTPVTNVNPIGNIKPGTVGQALPETHVKISDLGEILIKGPQVMVGYYKNQEATDEVMTEEGYFRTGDIGVIDEEGFLSITGRIKDIIVTAGGKNISPQNIEGSIKGSPYIEQAAVIGDKRKYLSALIIPSFESLKAWAQNKGIEFQNNKELVDNEEVKKLLEQEINEKTTQFARVEQIQKFTIFDSEWTQETGELTPSLKVKRRVLEEKYKDEIETMYLEE